MKILIIIAVLFQISSSYTYNMLVVNDREYWTREITNISFDNDSLYISAWKLDTSMYIADIDTMYFDSTGYVSRYVTANHTYLMGSRADYPSTRIHTVMVYNMHVDVGLVSQSEYKRLMGVEPWLRYEGACENVGDSLPANYMTWTDACMYCNARSIEEGLEPVYNFDVVGTPGDSSIATSGALNTNANGWRLLTEAEYEYLARSGNFNEHYTDTSEARFWGNDWYPAADTLAWPDAVDSEEMHEVCSKKPSPYGVYDIEGHMRSWCWDKYMADWYTAYPQDYVYEGDKLWGPGHENSGPRSGSGWVDRRVIRGSVMWGRNSTFEYVNFFYLGFRCCRFAK